MIGLTDAGVDTLVMKHFLSGFSDADADLILKRCKQVLPAQGRILLLQTLVPEAGDRQHNVCRDGVAPGEFLVVRVLNIPSACSRAFCRALSPYLPPPPPKTFCASRCPSEEL